MRFDDLDITGMAPHRIAALGLARTFQNIRLFGLMTAEENVMVAMHSHLQVGGASARCSGRRGNAREEREARDEAAELLDFVGHRGVDEELRPNLSYGDQRRLEVARALALGRSSCCSTSRPPA